MRVLALAILTISAVSKHRRAVRTLIATENSAPARDQTCRSPRTNEGTAPSARRLLPPSAAPTNSQRAVVWPPMIEDGITPA